MTVASTRPIVATARPATLLGAALRFRTIVLGIALISGIINLLFLSGSIFMLEVYDRVLPSRSLPTLVGLGALLALLYAFQGVLDLLRARILVRTGTALFSGLGDRLFAIALRLKLSSAGRAASQPLADLEQVRRFLSSGAPAALFDLPWIPIYLLVCFSFHAAIGWTALVGALVLIGLAVASERLTEIATRKAHALGLERDGLAEAAVRNAEVVAAMGLGDALRERWQQANGPALAGLQRTGDIAAQMSAFSKVIRLALQSLVLAVGAWLVINGEATGGIMIASSILAARALAPVEQAIANWRGLALARQAWDRISVLLDAYPARAAPHRLAPPSRSLVVDAVSATAPGAGRPLLRDISFRLTAGDCLGVIGQSGSGKSTLSRVIVGVWPALLGSVRLDGATLDQWEPALLGRHIGYLPQDVELFAGTVAQNIARFTANADAAAIAAAAGAAEIHAMILALPQGYDTQIGESGGALSAGQRQRVALARALFGDPFLVVLDEPNSNLDADGDAALTRAIEGVRQRGGVVVIVAHRPSALSAANLLLVLGEGRQQGFGERDAILTQLASRRALGPKAVAS